MAQERLAEAPSGTRVVTFHGMGGDMPDGYERVLQEFQDIGFLELWIKNPSPEELISFQRISPRPENLQAPVSPRARWGECGKPALVHFRASTDGRASGSEESPRRSSFQNPCLELPILCSRS